ncbi:MAG: hypothetical protein JL50_15590 [Peptococcaceae bacterium BICA1-7]|nr:MAG: hypothetical protein JL50_15590 [Peptococcaceae bacterium BICA1-7]
MAMSPWDRFILHRKNPWMVMWWSAALPGLGHLCQSAYFKGINLMFWEIVINFKARLNQGILFTLTGNFEKAREVVNTEWALVYGALFCFAIFDSYRMGVELNLIAGLEKKKKKKRKYSFIKMKPTGINYLDRGNPWVAAAWSSLLPGFGHIYNMKAVKSLIILGWALAIIHFSHVNDGVILTFTGEFSKAREIVNYQWLIFFPSIYLFSIWDSYNDAVEMNKLFEEEQTNNLLKNYGKKINL